MKEIIEWMQANQWCIILPGVLIFAYYLLKWKIESIRSRKAIIKEREKTGNKFVDCWNEEIEYFVDETPTRAIAFGSKCDWIAIKSDNHEEVVQEFTKKGKKSFRTNLESGVYAASALNIFVFPPIQSWILALNPLDGRTDDKQFAYLKELSKKYEEVQFFGSFRGVNYSSWMKFTNGETIRAYSVADGETIRNEGALTDMEIEFIEIKMQDAPDDETLDWIKGEGRLLCMSDEENVLLMAEKWSINPGKLDQMDIEGLGTIIES
jgi:hypothetical protein